MIDHIVVRKQILVLKMNTFLVDKDRFKTLRADVMEQMKTGIVIIPNGVEAFTVDADEVKGVMRTNDADLQPDDPTQVVLL